MKLGMQVGLGSGHILLDGNTAPRGKGAQQPQCPTFEIFPYNPQPMSVVANFWVSE